MNAARILAFACALLVLLAAAGFYSQVCILLAAALVPLVFVSKGKQSDSVVDPRGRAVVVTGCDSGFGYLLAKKLDHLGFTVFATVLFPDGEGAQKLRAECSSLLKTVKCNVTQDVDVTSLKKFVETDAPEKGLWGLVNNAGISTWGEVEWNTLQGYKRLADVNLFGSIRTTLAFIPLIRKSKGRMVFMSSTNAAITSQCNSMYCVTKRGLEAFCDSLRTEMKKFGVMVTVVRPGDFSSATEILKNETAEDVWNKFTEEAKQVYSKEYVQTYTEEIEKRLKKKSRDLDDVICAIVEALMASNPKAQYTVASVAETLLAFICTHFPYSVLVPFFCSNEGEKERKKLIAE